MGILKLYKKKGETPLECIFRYKKSHPKFEKVKMTYAGRLDPLAEGVLIVLYGEGIKNKEKYLKLNKEYEVDVLFGFATDTYDMLGRIIQQSTLNQDDLLRYFGKYKNRLDMGKILKSFAGKFKQKYPPYSSKFFERARSGELKDEEITTKDVEIKSIRLLGQKDISKSKLEKYVKDSINLVQGDFRQVEILKIWRRELPQNKIEKFPIISIKVKCTSGTYMRSLANDIGKKMEVPALALKIKRTRVGKFKI